MNSKSYFPIPATWVAAMLAALLAAVLLSACSTQEKTTRAEAAAGKLDELTTAVRSVIKDDARAGKVVALIDDIRSLVIAQHDALKAHEQSLNTLLANYETSDADLRSMMTSFNAGRNQRALRGIEITLALRAATTPEEWAELQKTRLKVLESFTDAARQN
jgi:hypothetical protein